MSESHPDQETELDKPDLDNEPDELHAEPSSPSEDQDGKEPTVTAYEAAQKAVGEQSSDSENDQEASKAAETGEKAAEDELSDDVTDDELQGYKPKTRRRIEKLLSQKTDLEGQLEALRGPASEYEKIDQYLRTNAISQEAAGEALEIAGLLQADPFKALELLTPIVRDLAVRTGRILPNDLQTQVREGALTRQHAVELAHARAQTGHLQETQLRQQQQFRAETQRRGVADMQSAVGEWERQIAAADPDYGRKQALVKRGITAELSARQRTGKLPQTREEAVELAKQVYSEVNETVSSFTPKKPEVRPLEGGTSGQAQRKPKSPIEAARLALQQG